MKLSYNFPLQNELFLSEPKIKEHKNKDFVINPFYPNPHFPYLPENIRTPYSFLMFSVGRERVYWEQIG